MAPPALTHFYIQPRPSPAGFFFCLAPAEGAGLLFCLVAIQPRTSVYSGFCAINAVIPPQPKKRLQDFVGAFPLILPITAHTV
nr:MAG TPA_asm: hypothetical protein [Caudoviricetes sp.]